MIESVLLISLAQAHNGDIETLLLLHLDKTAVSRNWDMESPPVLTPGKQYRCGVRLVWVLLLSAAWALGDCQEVRTQWLQWISPTSMTGQREHSEHDDLSQPSWRECWDFSGKTRTGLEKYRCSQSLLWLVSSEELAGLCVQGQPPGFLPKSTTSQLKSVALFSSRLGIP